MRILLSVAAVLAWLFGGALLFAPAHGATLVGLGVVNWLARNADRRGVRAVLIGNLVVQLLSLGVVARTMALGAGRAVAPGVVIHVTLAAWFIAVLARMQRSVP